MERSIVIYVFDVLWTIEERKSSMKYYLVDTENVATRWTQCAEKAEPGDMFILFYSKNVGAVSMGLFGPACLRGIRFDFVECHVGPNALDFQLATELGRLVALHPEAGFSIVSRDAGFDPVVKYWRDRGVGISREGPAVGPAAKPEVSRAAADSQADPVPGQPAGPVPDQPENPAAPHVHTAQHEYQKRLQAVGLAGSDLHVAMGIITAAMRQPAKRRRIDACNRFRQRYGTQDGLSRYNALKELIADIAANGPFPPDAAGTAGASGAEQAPPPPADGSAGNPGPLDEAISGLGITLTAKQHEKLSNMIRHARKTQNKQGVYRKQLKESFGTSKGDRIFEATEYLL